MGDGRRGLGPQGGRVRDAVRAGELSRVRRDPPATRYRRRRPCCSTWRAGRAWRSSSPESAARPAPASTRRRAWSPWRSDRNPGRRHPGRRHGGAPVGRRDASTSSPASAASGAPHRAPSTRRTACSLRGGRIAITVLGQRRQVARRVDDGAVPLGHRREDRAPGRHGVARTTRRRRGVPGRARVRRRRAVRGPVRASSTPTPRRTPGPRRDRPGLRGDPEHRRGRVRRARDRARRASTCSDGLPLRGQIQLFGYIGTKR